MASQGVAVSDALPGGTASSSPYDVGSLVRTSAAFTNASGTAADPTTIVLRFANLVATPTVWTYLGTGSIVKDSTGNYHADLDTTALPGEWRYRWIGTGAVQAAGDGAFQVRDSPIK